MKNFRHRNIIYLILFPILILFSDCYKYPDMDDVSYEDYRRLVGPDGGKINFYKNYENDSSDVILVSMDFPKKSLDSFVVFNMYQFYDEIMNNDLEQVDMFVNTKFLYFVPFFKSYGYNEQIAQNSEYHVSVEFKQPVTITYNVEEPIDKDIDNEEDMPKLYRIKIPKLSEWDENVWIDWNYQGYPNGYYNNDLIYLINGRWSNINEWGMGTLSIINWEEVPIYTYNSNDMTVTFDISSTDYMYVMAAYIPEFP